MWSDYGCVNVLLEKNCQLNAMKSVTTMTARNWEKKSLLTEVWSDVMFEMICVVRSSPLKLILLSPKSRVTMFKW